MSGFILGIKKSQTQQFDTQGKSIPVTKIVTELCKLISVQDVPTRGYVSATVAYGTGKNTRKSVAGQLKSAGVSEKVKGLKEIRLEKLKGISVVEKDGKKGIQIKEVQIFPGDEITAEMMFVTGDVVQVTGTSKGKGFQGGVKRHGFAGGPKTHGQSDRHRAPGSVGPNTTPGHVLRGQRMAGRMGGMQSTVKKLHIVDAQKDFVSVKGLVPGHIGSYVTVIGY